jgi:hypothetical protein
MKRKLDSRYKDNVDKGAMSFHIVPIPLKLRTKIKQEEDNTPKQILRQKKAKLLNEKVFNNK